MRPSKSNINFFVFVLFWVLLFRIPTPLYSQEFLLPQNKKREIVPFKLVKDLIIIPVTINEYGPFNFILDTGVGIVLISDYSLADSLRLQNIRNLKISGFGEREDLEAYISPGLSMGVGAAKAVAINAAILKKDVFNLSEYVGMPIHGILGYEFFKGLIVRISYNNQVLGLYPENSSYLLRKGFRIPISIEEHKPYLEASVTLSNGERVKTKLVMDTGAGHPLSLENRGGVPFPIPDVNIADNLGVGLAGPISGYLGRTNEVILGKYILRDVITAFPDYKDVVSRVMVPGRNGNLGNSVLKHFELVIDYNRGSLYVKPSIYFKDRFEHDMSGLEITSMAPDFKR